MKRLTRILSAALGTLAMLGLGNITFAATVIEEIVVTAQRTEESLQSVPIAVTALTGEMLEDKGIINPSDLQMTAPNVSFTSTNFGGSSFSIRGVGRLVIAASGDSGVSTHINEIPLNSNLNAIEFFDVERVELLRGPQGTLYGRNATGGSVNMITTMPKYDALDGFVDVEAGDYNHFRVKGAINIPFSDTMGLRLAGFDLSRDGYIENLAADSVSVADANGEGGGDSLPYIDDDIDGRDIQAYRATWAWDFSDNGDVWVQYNKFEEDDDRARITNQVCQRTELPTLGCEPNGFGYDSPHLGSTTGGLFFMTNGRATLPFGASGVNGEDGIFYDHPAPQLGLRTMFTDFEPIFEYEEEVWSLGASYEFSDYTVSFLGARQETDYLAQMDYNMDVGPVLKPSVDTLGNTFGFAAGTWPTSAPAGRASEDVEGGPCNYGEGTAGIFGGCIVPSDGTRLFAMDSATANTEYWTAEIRFSSQLDGPINFQAGYSRYEFERYGDYYVNANSLDSVGLVGSSLLAPGLGLYPTMFNVPGSPNDPSYNEGQAIFAEVYYDITDKLKLTVGLRRNEDEKFVNTANAFLSAVDQNILLFGYVLSIAPRVLGDAATGTPADIGPTIGAVLGLGDANMFLDPNYAAALNSLPGQDGPGGKAWGRNGNPAALSVIAGAATDLDRARFAFFNIPQADIDAAFGTLPFSQARADLLAAIGPVTGFNEVRVLQGNPDTTEWTATTGRIGLDYQWNDEVLVYGFLTRGYKPGGFNPPIAPEFQSDTAFSFEQEEVDAIELGFKSTLLDGQLILNGSAFAYDYVGLQVTRIRNNSSINENIDAEIMGLELEWTWQPAALENLAVDGSFSWLDTELQGVSSVDVLDKGAGDPNWANLKNIDPGAATGTNYVAWAPSITQAVVDAAIAALPPALRETARALTYEANAEGVAIPAYFSRNFLGSITPDGQRIALFDDVWVRANAAGDPVDANDMVLADDVDPAMLVTMDANGDPYAPVSVSSGENTNISGNSLPNSPELTFRLGAQYTWPVSVIAGDLTLRWDYYWQDESYGREFNTIGDEIDSWDQHNLSLIYESTNGDWQARLWARNLQDDDNVTGHYLTSDTSGYYRNYFLTEPRVYGLSVRYQFSGTGG